MWKQIRPFQIIRARPRTQKRGMMDRAALLYFSFSVLLPRTGRTTVFLQIFLDCDFFGNPELPGYKIRNIRFYQTFLT